MRFVGVQQIFIYIYNPEINAIKLHPAYPSIISGNRSWMVALITVLGNCSKGFSEITSWDNSVHNHLAENQRGSKQKESRDIYSVLGALYVHICTKYAVYII